MTRRAARVFDGLRVRILGVVTLALLPLGLVALYQTHQVIREAEELSRRDLSNRILQEAGSQLAVIQETLGAARGLASALTVDPADDTRCAALMRSFIDSNPTYAFAGYIPAGGLMRCTSNGAVVDYSGYDGFDDLIRSGVPQFDVNQQGDATGKSVIIVSTPLRTDDAVLGLVSVSVTHDIVGVSRDGDDTPFELATLNLQGEVLASTLSLETAPAALPADMPIAELTAREGSSFVARNAAGDRRLFAVRAIIGDKLVLVGSWPVSAGWQFQYGWHIVPALTFPLAIWLTATIVAYLGLHSQVLRHIRALRRAMRRFTLGQRKDVRLSLDRPPIELAEVEAAFNVMVDRLTEAEKTMAEDLKHKTVLLREVHHRVKNNLQLIASIMNMQTRNARTPEARLMLSQLLRRVRGLSAIHRSLHTTPDMTTVDTRPLVEDLVADLAPLLSPDPAQPAVRIETDIESVTLYPDQAVPFSMLFTEAMTNAVKYLGRPEGGAASINVTLRREAGDKLRLRLVNTVGIPVSAPEEGVSSTGLGSRLIEAFVAQLEGTQTVDEGDTHFVYEVVFPVEDFARADTPLPAAAPAA
ncbi:MAG: histidine kinase dimerization/phosphoacceptor domain -containing protein [Pseudomonadota bacterium]